MFRKTHRSSLGAQKLWLRSLVLHTFLVVAGGRNYSFWAPDDGRCVARNILSN